MERMRWSQSYKFKMLAMIMDLDGKAGPAPKTQFQGYVRVRCKGERPDDLELLAQFYRSVRRKDCGGSLS